MCVFCRIIAGEMPAYVVHRDEWAAAFLDINPIGRGHCLVVPRHHSQSLHDLPRELVGPLMEAVRIVSGRAMRALGADGFNLFLNDGAAAGQIVMHLHFHVVPRFAGDGVAVRARQHNAGEDELRDIQRAILAQSP